MGLRKVVFLSLLIILIFTTFSFASSSKVRIGILYFVPRGDDLPWVRKGITILLINRLSQFSEFYILPRDKLEAFDYNMFSATNIKTLSSQFSLDYVVGGTYSFSNDVLDVSVWVWGKKENKFLLNFSTQGAFLDILKKLSVSIYDAIAGTINDNIAEILKDLPTRNEVACKYLFTAVDYMDQAIKAYNGADFPSKPLWKKAIGYGEMAKKEDPKFYLTYYYLGLIYSKTKWIKREAEAWDNYLKYAKEKEFPEEAGGLAYYRLGYSFYEKKEYDMAERYLKKAISIDPTLVKPYVYLGNIYFDENDLDKAIEYYKKAYKLSPSDKDIKWLLKRAQRIKEVGKEAYDYFEKGREAFVNENYYDAVYFLEHAVGINDTYLEAYVLLGKAYIEIDELKKAEDALSKAEALDPTNYEIKFLLDKVKSEIKYGKEAYEAFDKGYSLYKEGKLEDALIYFKKAIKENGAYDMAHDYLARTYYKLGRLDEYKRERDQFAALIEDPKKRADEYYLTGFEFFSLKRYDIAEEEFKKVLSIDPQHEKAAFFLAETYYNLKKYRNAITYYTKVIDIRNSQGYYDKALYGRAWSYFFLKKYKKEIRDLLTLISLFKDSPVLDTAYYKLGEAYYLTGDYISAIKYLKSFIDQKNSQYRKDALYIVIASYIKTKDLKKAKEYLDSALSLYPDDKKFLELKTVLRDYAFNNKDYEVLLSELSGRSDEVSIYEKIIALLELGRIDSAEFELSRFMRRYPESKYLKDIYLAFLNIYIKEKNNKKAVEILTYAIDKGVTLFPSMGRIYFARGKLYYDLKDYKDAIPDFEKAIEKDVENLSEAYYFLAISYMETGQKDKALSIFQELGDRFKDRYACLGSYYIAGEYYRKENLDDAFKYYKKITLTCKKFDYLDKVHFYLGMIHYQKSNFNSAIWNFKKSLSLTKEIKIKIEDYYFIGKAYEKWGKIQDAKKWFKKVVDEGKGTKYYTLAKKELDMIQNMPYEKAQNLLSKGRFKEALEVLSTVEDASPKKSYLMAKAYMGLERWDKAEELFLNLLNSHSADNFYEEIVYGLSFIYIREKKYFLLIDLVDDYIKHGKFGNLGDDIMYLSGISYEMLGKSDKAVSMYKKILHIFPDTPLKNKIEKRLEVLR